MLTELHTERLFLREMQLEDGPALQEFQNRPEQWRHMAMEPEEFADGTRRVQRYFEHCGPDDQRRIFGYVAGEKMSGAIIGQVSLSRSHPAMASLGFGTASQHWGKGYATEMAERLIAFGFNEVGLHRISADVAVSNVACMRVMEKIGMHYEGTARDCIWAQGRWWTEAQYAMLATDDRHAADAAVAKAG